MFKLANENIMKIKGFHEYEYDFMSFQMVNINGDEIKREYYVATKPNSIFNNFWPKVPNVTKYFRSLVM